MLRHCVSALSALLALATSACVSRPSSAPVPAQRDSVLTGPQMRRAYWYNSRPYGSERTVHPLTSILNNGYDQIRTGPNRQFLEYDYSMGGTGAWNSIIHAQRVVRQFGTRDWVRFELLPLSLKADGGGQWVPNYQLHLFGGGVTYVRLIGFFEQRGFSYPRAAAGLTSFAGHFLNEMVENTGLTGGSVDAMTDLLIFDPASILLWNSDRVQRFVGERVEITEWAGQPSVSFPGSTLENAFQTTMVRIRLPRTKDWRAFTTMGGSYVGGISRRSGEDMWYSLGFGWDARSNPVVDPATGRKTVELIGNVALFVDRQGSLLASALLKSGLDAAATINVYPGLGSKHMPGFWAQLLRDPTTERPSGVRFGITSAIGVGIGRNP
jgi:hypothetical protein